MVNNNNAFPIMVTILGTTFVVGTLSSLGWFYYFTTKDNHTKKQTRQGLLRSTDSQHEISTSPSSLSSQKFKPPFPQKIRDMLSNCRLAYLSTIDADSSSSHLSLMRFTYWQHPDDGEVVIMSTNRNTKKYEFLKQQRGVALLVHDFGSGHESNSGLYSITLNGECRILNSGTPKAEEYRQAHLRHNPDYPQFIVGDSIDILCVDITSARICDIQDQVVHWNVEQQTQQQQQQQQQQPSGPNVVSKTLVQISSMDLQELVGEESVAAIPSVDAASFPSNDVDVLFASRPDYDTLRISIPPKQQQLLQSLLDKLQDAFGPQGLGFLEVTDIPSPMIELRSKLLPMAEQLATLPSSELQSLERPEQGWTIGWSHGREHFKDGTYDIAKGSFYTNPFFASNDGNPNVYPPSLQPQLEERLMTMTQFMTKVSRWVGTVCDLYLQRDAGCTGALDDPWMISKSLVSGLPVKARLLYYFPKIGPNQSLNQKENIASDVAFDDWCGQHKDHGSITALLPGMFCEHNNSTKRNDSLMESNDHFPPGLYIETRQHELVHASLAFSSLGMQVGETLQIMSRGKFRATPHSVKAPSSSQYGRASLAVFLQPLANQVLPPLTRTDNTVDDDGYGLHQRWRRTFGEFQQATTDKFN